MFEKNSKCQCSRFKHHSAKSDDQGGRSEGRREARKSLSLSIVEFGGFLGIGSASLGDVRKISRPQTRKVLPSSRTKPSHKELGSTISNLGFLE